MAVGTAYLPLYLFVTVCCICGTFVNGITYTMLEESRVGSYIGNVSADSGLKDVVGEDEFSNLRYSILSGGSQNSQLFQISPTTGVLSVGNRVDREELCPFADTCQLTLEIAAQYESLLRKFNVKIVVEDINDNSPSFPRQSIQRQLSESTSVDFPLSLDVATDLDGSANFTVHNYSLLPVGVPFRVLHTKNAVGVSQLSLLVSQPLDRETRSSYTLTVWAYDGGSPPRSGSVTVTVNVLDVNDNAPKFTADVYTQNISESTPTGTPILTVTATDVDEGDNARVVYSISSQQPVTEQEKFSIGSSSGVVSVAHSLKAGVHRVLVEAQDQGTPPKPPTQAVMQVTVLDTDNSPPVLSLDMLSVSDFQPGLVPESEKVSTAVGYLAVSDPDSGANALVTCNSRNEHFELQSLNLNEYKVIISKTLDRENVSYFNVALVCFDGGSPRLTSTATFEVFVVDVNDNPPVFLDKQYTASVAENNGPSDGLLQVAATDADAGNNANISYSLVGAEDMFQVGAHTGMIKTRGQLDYELRSRYVFTVLAVDMGQPPLTATATVTVNVLDINDVPPSFLAPNYTFSVGERLGPGIYVGNVSASDPDTGLGGQVILSMVQQPGLVLPFRLSSTGQLTTTATLDREQRPTFTFPVLATDRGMQPLSSSVTVTVNVLDVNDNAPTFVFSNDNATERIQVPIDAEFVVANVRAIDGDAGVNGTVMYSVVGGNASNLFRIERNTGAVVTLIDLDGSRVGWYQLVIRASDQGPVPQHTDRNLTLQVRRKNEQGLVTGGESEGDDGDSYVIIVVCIVVFTALVAMAVVLTMCVLRKLDQDRKLKYTAACCPDGVASPHRGEGGSLDTSSEYHQQVTAVSGGLDSKTAKGGATMSSSLYPDLHPHKADSGSFSLAPTRDMLGFPQHPSSNVRTSQLQLSQSHAAHSGRKTPLQLDAARRADDFHSTSSAETTTGDSGHGSDEDIANHSHDRPLSPANHHPHLHQHPPPRPLRLGGGRTSPFSSLSGHRSTPDPSSPRPVFVQGGQFRSNKPHSSVRFSADVTNYDALAHHSGSGGSRGRYTSNDSIRDDESDLNTTTSGSFSVPPDDLYDSFRHQDFRSFNTGSGGQFEHDMLV